MALPNYQEHFENFNRVGIWINGHVLVTRRENYNSSVLNAGIQYEASPVSQREAVFTK